MNPDEAKITDMIAVCDTPNLNARLGYEIDLKTNKVRYVLKTHFKYLKNEKTPNGTTSEVRFAKYEGARSVFDSLPAIAERDAAEWKSEAVANEL
ncbi:MAG: hypothetical protein II649_12200 [Kiritimatiellae bacterium]|nr:hypothetical protein [Kiritimatiellia bacterium]MBQ5795524.1 hypothetical protein [Kiritimatiellia bacterium]